MASDDELWPTSHTTALYDALPNAQLAIVPNTSHLLVFEQPSAVAQHITAFFDHPERAETLFPTSRPAP
jgi:pimeloyl-ACP methyl ester carboxylesterase